MVRRHLTRFAAVSLAALALTGCGSLDAPAAEAYLIEAMEVAMAEHQAHGTFPRTAEDIAMVEWNGPHTLWVATNADSSALCIQLSLGTDEKYAVYSTAPDVVEHAPCEMSRV